MSDAPPPPGSRARETAWLVLRAQAGDRPALEALLEHAHAMLLPYVAVMVRDGDAAADVLQEILVLLYRRLPALREPRAFAAWARRIASREIFRALRKLRRHERTHDELPHDVPAEPDPEPASEGLLARLPALLERVSPASRAVVALHYLDGLTLDETAAVLDLPAGTVKSRLAYGLATLRRVLAEEGTSTG